jgi:hypothetical protein
MVEEGLEIQYLFGDKWVFVSNTNARNVKRDLAMFKEQFPTRKYRVWNKGRGRVVYQ